MSLNESVPSGEQSKVAEWLSKQQAYERLPEVALNGPTPLFWYVVSLITEYHNAPVVERQTPTP